MLNSLYRQQWIPTYQWAIDGTHDSRNVIARQQCRYKRKLSALTTCVAEWSLAPNEFVVVKEKSNAVEYSSEFRLLLAVYFRSSSQFKCKYEHYLDKIRSKTRIYQFSHENYNYISIVSASRQLWRVHTVWHLRLLHENISQDPGRGPLSVCQRESPIW